MKLIYKLVEVAEQFGQRSDENAVLIRNQSQAIKDAVKVRIQPVADYLYMETVRWTQLLRQRSADLKVQNPARVSRSIIVPLARD